MVNNHIFRKYLGFILFTLTICLLIVYYYTKSNGYQVTLNGKVVAYIKDKNKFETENKALFKEINSRFGDFNYKDKVSYKKTRVKEKGFNNNSVMNKIFIQNSKSEVPAFKMKSDEKVVGIVANENEGNETIKTICSYYKEKNKLNNSDGNVIKNKITYEKTNVKLSEVKEVKEIASSIIKENQMEKTPLITVIQKNKVQSTEEIKYDSKVNLTDTLSRGEKKIVSNGKSGTKLLNKEITLENDKIVSQKILNEEIITKPINNVIEEGTKDVQTLNSSYISFPSKGSISSKFGLRWGKMHEGIDIASNTGNPIYSALDGTVTYAGYQSGYGNLINVSSANKIVTYYGHCSSINVKLKDVVHKGDLIGRVGNTGVSTGPHLHFEVRVNGVPVDPSNYLK